MEEINALLPDEMLQKVFSFLSPLDLKTSVLVCKRWAEVGEAPGLWSWVTFTVDRINMGSMPELMSLKRLQCVTKLDIRAQMVSKELMEAVAIHPGLKRVDTNPGYTNLSSVKPELLAKALNKIEDVRLLEASLTPQQLNHLYCSISFDETNSIQRLDLIENDLTSIEPAVLAQAVSKLRCAILLRTLSKLVPHGVAIMDAVGRACSRTRHLHMDTVDLSTLDADLLGQKVCRKLSSLYLADVELTPQQATALFEGIKEEYNCLRFVGLDFNQLSSVEPSILVQAMTTLQQLTLKNTRLTHQQVEAIFDALEEPGRLQGLTLSGNNLSFVDPAKITRANALQQMIMCHTNLTIKQVISIVEGSLSRTRLRRIRWTDYELDGTAGEWQTLHFLFSRAASLGINIFQGTKCPCLDADNMFIEDCFMHMHKYGHNPEPTFADLGCCTGTLPIFD